MIFEPKGKDPVEMVDYFKGIFEFGDLLFEVVDEGKN